jgi:hypothetical protein
MLFRLFAFLCLAGLSFGALPRPLADVPILYPDGTKLSLKTKYRGRVMAIVLISTSCNGCREMVELFTKMREKFGPRGFVVVGAAIEENAKFNLVAWAKRYRPQFEIGYLEREGAIKLADMPPTGSVVPILLFVDKKGQVRFQAYGNDPIMKEKEKAIPAIIDSLLKDAQGPLSTTKQVGPDGKELPPSPTKK